MTYDRYAEWLEEQRAHPTRAARGDAAVALFSQIHLSAYHTLPRLHYDPEDDRVLIDRGFGPLLDCIAIEELERRIAYLSWTPKETPDDHRPSPHPPLPEPRPAERA